MRIVGFDEVEDLWFPKDLIDENLIQAFHTSHGGRRRRSGETFVDECTWSTDDERHLRKIDEGERKKKQI